MQYHGQDEGPDSSEKRTKSVEKSYVKRKDGIFLSSHVARWQLMGVIKSMRMWGLEVSDASRMASEVGLQNGVYNVMMYDGMVCRRGHLRRAAFEKILENYIEKLGKEKETMSEMVAFAMCFLPMTGIQVDYTAGFHISEDAVPEDAKGWTKRKGSWPCLVVNYLLLNKPEKQVADKLRKYLVNFVFTLSHSISKYRNTLIHSVVYGAQCTV